MDERNPPSVVGRYVAAIARHGLAGEPGDGWPTEPLDDRAWSLLLPPVRHGNLLGFFVWAMRDGFPVTDAQADEVAEEHATKVASCLVLERMLLEVAGWLSGDGIRFRLLKGPALARWAYPDPAIRLFGDIDLLVASEDWDRAIARLDRAGLDRSFGEPRPGWARRFAKGNVFKTDDGFELDLHRTFVGGPLGLTLDLDALFADTRSVDIGGTSLPALGADAAVLHACYNAALSELRPKPVPSRDLAQLLLRPEIDPERLLRTAGDARATAVVARAVRVAGGVLAFEQLPLAGWAAGYRPTPWERVALLAYTDPGRNTPRETALGLLAVPGVRAKLDYVLPLLAPQGSYLEGRHASRRQRALYAMRRLTGWTGLRRRLDAFAHARRRF